MGVPEDKALLTPILEFSYKNDDLGDPFINDYYALALGLATKEELDTIAKYAFKVNEFMVGFFKKLNIDLIDSRSSLVRLPTVRSFWLTRSLRIPAVSGTAPLTRSSTRIASAEIWAMSRKLIRKS